MTRFAENTSVPVERSQAELQRLLRKHGAGTVATLQRDGGAAVAFEIGGRRVRLELTFSDRADLLKAAANEPPHGWKGWGPQRKIEWADKQVEQSERQRWRALLLVVKAKLELVAEGSSTVEREFMADLLLPSGERVEQWLLPQLAEAFKTGKRLPPLLPEKR